MSAHRPIRTLSPIAALALTVTLAIVAASPVSAATTAAVPDSIQTTVDAKPSATSVYVERTVTVRGAVGGLDASGREVDLQRWSGNSWVTDDSATSDSDGHYALHDTPYSLGTWTLRVSVPSTIPTLAATSETFTVRANRKPVPTSGSFSLFYPQINGTWGRWNPCATITYRVDPASGGATARDRIADAQGAVGRLSQATGLRIAYQGTTTAVPGRPGSTYPAGTDLVIAWAEPGTTSWMPRPRTGQQANAGEGGAITLTTTYNTQGLHTPAITEAGVVVNADIPLTGGFGSGPTYGYQGTRGQLLLHELGHAVGLGHTGDRAQIMYPTMLRKPAAYGHGDRDALRLVGATQGCLTTQPPPLKSH